MTVYQFQLFISNATFISSFQLTIYQSIFFFYGGNGLPYSSGDSSGKKGSSVIVRSPYDWPSSPKRRQRSTAAVTAHFIASFCRRLKWTVTRTVRVPQEKVSHTGFWWQSCQFCLNRPFSGHQYSYKCPTMSCTRQKIIETSVYMTEYLNVLELYIYINIDKPTH